MLAQMGELGSLVLRDGKGAVEAVGVQRICARRLLPPLPDTVTKLRSSPSPRHRLLPLEQEVSMT